jgi:hypothetical protein
MKAVNLVLSKRVYLLGGVEVETYWRQFNRKNYRAILRKLGLCEKYKYHYIITKVWKERMNWLLTENLLKN